MHDHIHAIVLIDKKCDVTCANLRITGHNFDYTPGRVYKGERNLHMDYLRKETQKKSDPESIDLDPVTNMTS
jgi:hypothetical protein